MEKAKTICLEMFNQRGYTLIENEGDQIICAKSDDTQIIAFFFKNPKFSVKDIQSYIGLMNELGIYHAVRRCFAGTVVATTGICKHGGR